MTPTSVELFTERAARYAAFRPSYPPGVTEALAAICPPPAAVADVGAGTGIFSRVLAGAGYAVLAVEPNASMREQAAAAGPRISIVEGRGEATNLPDASVDLITVAQAFQWLDRSKAQLEFRRIGRPGCRAAVLWNSREFAADDFMRGYHQMLLDVVPGYAPMRDGFWRSLDQTVADFFAGHAARFTFDNSVCVGLDALIGNLLSASYVPQEGDPGHGLVVRTARQLFERHQKVGTVSFRMKTVLYAGDLP
jgi:SAM-dependent methyltransferase